jgi:phosphonate transport system substrate-binding protein
MLERYTPLANYVAKATGYEGGKVVIHDSADLVIGKLCDGSLDLVLESVYSVAQAVRSCGAVPLVVAAKGNTYRYHSVVFVRSDSPVKTLSELGGKDILFEDPTSTSGYIVPRMMIEDAGVALLGASEAPRPTAVRYRFGREELNLVGWVVHGLVAAASTADLDLEGFEDADVRVIGRSAPLPRQLIVMGPHVAKERGAKIVSTLVGMGADVATKDILTKADTAGFALLEAHDQELITRLSRRSEVE